MRESGAPSGYPRNIRSPLNFSISTSTSLRFKKTLRANIAAASGAKSRSAPAAELRDHSTSLCFFPTSGFLSLIEQHAPPALG